VKIVLDTHILLHAAAGDLAPAREKLLEGSRTALFISAVTLWEITKLVELGCVSLPGGFEAFLRDLCSHPRYAVVQYDPALMLEVLVVAPRLPGDPADQIIVATARHLGATLMTDDRRIRRSKLLEVI
jgi:PIN domain nuclease of toxin-antitoxin system